MVGPATFERIYATVSASDSPILTIPDIVAGVVFIVAVCLTVGAAAGAYRKYRGSRLVACPETRAPAVVEVDARHAALTAAFGRVDVRLQGCSRWPERRDCGQPCLAKIEAAPDNAAASRREWPELVVDPSSRAPAQEQSENF